MPRVVLEPQHLGVAVDESIGVCVKPEQAVSSNPRWLGTSANKDSTSSGEGRLALGYSSGSGSAAKVSSVSASELATLLMAMRLREQPGVAIGPRTSAESAGRRMMSRMQGH